MPPGDCAAYSVHVAAILYPTSGNPATQSGGGGIVIVCSALAQFTISSEYSTIVLTAVQNGSTNTSSMATVITATAGRRRRPKAASIFSISGQVATTIIVAQMTGTRNGRMIQMDAAIMADDEQHAQRGAREIVSHGGFSG